MAAPVKSDIVIGCVAYCDAIGSIWDGMKVIINFVLENQCRVWKFDEVTSAGLLFDGGGEDGFRSVHEL